MGRKSVREMDCCDQVDFCPFRGPDAPFALRRSYHEGRKVGHDCRVRKIFSPTLTGICVCDAEMYIFPNSDWDSGQIILCSSSSSDRHIATQRMCIQQLRFCGRLAPVSTCITTNRPRDTESRSSCRHSQGFGCGRQSEMKCCAPSIVRCGPQVAAVRFHNGSAD